MKAHEAYAAIEDRAAQLDLPPWMGEELMPIEKLGMASRYHGDLGRNLDISFSKKEITPAFYADCWFQLLDEYARHLVRTRLEKILTEET